MHRTTRWSIRAAAALAPAVICLMDASALASNGTPPNGIQGRRNQYIVEPLVSDGVVQAPFEDANLINPWGLARGPAGPFWVADNGADMATLYAGDGVANPLVVSLPPGAAPTGIVFNGSQSFVVSDGINAAPALFLFAGEDGRIFGWNPEVPPPIPSPNAFLVHDNSVSGAIYKGLAIAAAGGGDRLYAADFHNRKVDVLDGSFDPVDLPPGAFVDERIPADFAPFGIQNIQGRIFVTYAKQDSDGVDEVAGRGLGFVSVFDTDGVLLGRIATRGPLNAPWGLAMAPAGFGRFSGHLLVGNFGDGRILAYRISDDLRRAQFAGALAGPNGRAIVIDGLWAIAFGNNLGAGTTDELFFTAGPGDEEHGLFGRINARR